MPMDTNEGLIEHNGRQYAEQRDVDPETIDWDNVVDKELSDKENWDRIKSEVGEEADVELEQDSTSKEIIKEKEKKVQEEYAENVEDYEDFVENEDKSEEVQTFYKFFNHYARAVARNHHDALIVKADPGIGKSYQLRNVVLPEELGTDGFDFHSGYCPPFQFYKKLYEVEQSPDQEVLVLDDIEGLINNKKALAILKQATWSETDERWVEWNSSPSKLKNKEGEDIPPKFQFTGRLIMVFNDVDEDDPIVNSLLDRCFYYELEFTYEQRQKLVTAVAEKGTSDHDIPKDQRMKIANWLCEVTNSATEDFNLRTLVTAFDIYEYNQDLGVKVGEEDWEELTKHLIEADEDLIEVRDIILNGDFDTVKERKNEYKKRTDNSGRTYARKREKLLDRSEKVQNALD